MRFILIRRRLHDLTRKPLYDKYANFESELAAADYVANKGLEQGNNVLGDEFILIDTEITGIAAVRGHWILELQPLWVPR